MVAHRCFTLLRSSILCGCINIPDRQVNAAWGRCPAACVICVKKKAWSLLGARRQNLSRLRVEKLGCASSRQIIPAILYTPKRSQVQSIEEVPGRQWGQRLAIRRQLSRQSPATFFACTSWAVSSLYLPKTAFAALANLQSEDLAL